MWAAIVWGGRIAILFDTGSSSWDRIRVGISIVLAITVVASFRTSRWVGPSALAYAAGVAVVWGRSLVSVWTSDNTIGFTAVHTVLAAVSFVLAALAVRAARSPEPDPTTPRTRTG